MFGWITIKIFFFKFSVDVRSLIFCLCFHRLLLINYANVSASGQTHTFLCTLYTSSSYSLKNFNQFRMYLFVIFWCKGSDWIYCIIARLFKFSKVRISKNSEKIWSLFPFKFCNSETDRCISEYSCTTQLISFIHSLSEHTIHLYIFMVTKYRDLNNKSWIIMIIRIFYLHEVHSLKFVD